ncbi:MAG: heme exporter protein CcmD [Reyranella sp.]|jgi:heme exporter protein CcmD|nr:heme exporter protein CcmD [Reyranella sp.]
MNHAPFILASYLVAFAILGGLAIASLAARSKARRELEVRGLDRKRQNAP